MKVLIIGLGSIAKKHILAILKIQPNSKVYALRSNPKADEVTNVTNVFDWEIANEVDFILISNPTNLHADTLLKAIEFEKPIFIEKPIFNDLDKSSLILEQLKTKKISTYIACVLRFHPVIVKLKEIIQNQSTKIDEVNVYCGSYLPNWRPNVDYRKVYSAISELGGGVHLDLIHEIDYLYWIFGKPIDVKSTLRTNSHLNLDVVDYANYQLIYNDFTANVTLNYYRKQSKREIEVVSERFIYKGDLLTYTLKDELNFVEIYNKKEQEINLYDLQMEYFIKQLNQKGLYENDSNTGVEVLKIVLNK